MAAQKDRKPDVFDRVWIDRRIGTVVDRMNCYLCVRGMTGDYVCNCHYRVRLDQAYRRPNSSSCIIECGPSSIRLLSPLELLAEI